MKRRDRPTPADFARLTEQIQECTKGFDLLNVHTVITDTNGNILYANPASQKQTGFSKEQVHGNNPGDLWGGNMSDSFYRDMWKTIKDNKKPFIGRVKNVRKDGTPIWQEIIVSPVLDANNIPIFYIGIEPDIGPVKQREDFIEQFVSIIAHQLKTPLTTSRWTLELLMNEGGLTNHQKEALSHVYCNNKVLIDLIGDLLVLSRIGAVPLTNQTINLSNEVKALIALIKSDYPQVQFSFTAKEPIEVKVKTKTLMNQIFSNLISNAAKYAADPEGKVAITLSKNERAIVFTVENNGPPIPKEEQPRLFTQFFRGTDALRRDKPGTGLGLYIVKQVAEYLGWKVSFESPKAGTSLTSFSISIPG